MKMKLMAVWTVVLLCRCCYMHAEAVNITSLTNPSEAVIDSFEDIQQLNVIRPEETGLELTVQNGVKGNSLCMDYDLSGKKLYVVLSKEIQLELPENYRFIFYIKGDSPRNNFEFKLTDYEGNTYWKKWENFEFPENWEKIEINKEDIVFAWGDKPGAGLSKVKTMEFAISSGKGEIGRPVPGNSGKVYIDELSVCSLPVLPDKSKGLLKNPGFEKGFEFWEKSGNAKEINFFPFQAYEGKTSAGVGNDEGPKSASGEISQYVEVPYGIKAGDIFVFSVWAMAEINYTGQVLAKLEFLDSDRRVIESRQSRVFRGKFGWKKITVSAAAPEKAKMIRVKCISRIMGTGQGGSFIWFDNCMIDNPVVNASSQLESSYSPGNVILDRGSWHSKRSDKEWIMVDFRTVKEFSGLSIDWDTDHAGKYEILSSLDGKNWSTICNAQKDKDGIDDIHLDRTYARHIKINCEKSVSGNGYGIRNIKIKELNEIITIKKYFGIMARQNPGYYPRWLLGQQVYWTSAGVYGDEEEAILCEDGSVEPHKRGFSITPFLSMDGRVITRDDVKVTHSLEEIYLPIPSVHWDYNDVKMDIKLLVCGKSGESIAYTRYKIENNRNEEASGELLMAVRPLQVYPPWQGGTDSFASIHKIKYRGDAVEINNKYKIFPLIKPGGAGSIAGSRYFKFPFKLPAPPELEGDITAFIRKGIFPKQKDVEDMEGFASSMFSYDFKLKPGESREYFIAMPLVEKEPSLNSGMTETEVKEGFEKMLSENVAFWKSKIDIVDIDIPEQDLINMIKANIGHNLVSKDGPALQPGARSYDKAWWRDGSIQASSLLKLGLTQEARDFTDWMVSFQYDTGEVPPIIDNKAEDPLWELKPPTNLKEYDSQGEMIWAVLEYYYFSRDKKFLEEKWDNVLRNLQFTKKLREQRLTDEYNVEDLDKRRYYGILPQSRSHEGYWFAHSYWDDWWALKGWKDAGKIAKILKKKESTIQWIEKEYNDFLIDLTNSIKATAKFKNVDYISGCAEQGDYDPTSVAVAINYSGELPNIEKYLQPYLDNTFNSYYKEHIKRVEPGASFHFTPYEARNAPVFIYMGQKERALSLIRFLLSCSRPYKWYQLAEVVNYEPRNPCYLGDMPHTWVGAEFMNAVRGLFVYERDNESLVIGGGIDEGWLERKEGVSARNLVTYFGNVNYTVKKETDTLMVNISGDAKPKEGFVYKSPFLKKKIKSVVINGKEWKEFSDDEVIFRKLPAEITVSYW